MISNLFPEIQKNFGFGCMRLPMIGTDVDLEETKKMVDHFLANGFNYFDTAHGYLDGKSEKAIKECLTSRYPRESYILTDKLSGPFFKTQEEILPLFESQLESCGVDYFDFYLMHAQNARNYEKFKECHAYETALELKKQGKIRHFGLSFHDSPEVLDRILTEYPQIEVVQIQFNYLDYENPAVESKKVYDVCVKHNKPIIIMEPVKGGILANLPDKAKAVLDDLKSDLSYPSYAVRFAAGFEKVCMVLSGMSNEDQMVDNVRYMKDFKPLSDTEFEAVEKVRNIILSTVAIECTACHYCVLDNKCPKNIKIPEIFACYNKKMIFHSWQENLYYNNTLTSNSGKASDCIKCGKCEKICPQNLKIRDLLVKAAEEFERQF